jgi:hypothetical protein
MGGYSLQKDYNIFLSSLNYFRSILILSPQVHIVLSNDLFQFGLQRKIRVPIHSTCPTHLILQLVTLTISCIWHDVLKFLRHEPCTHNAAWWVLEQRTGKNYEENSDMKSIETWKDVPLRDVKNGVNNRSWSFIVTMEVLGHWPWLRVLLAHYSPATSAFPSNEPLCLYGNHRSES